MTTATMDFDPIFVRALRLLHSRSKDSASQLRNMVDECLRQSTPPHQSYKGMSASPAKRSDSEPNKRSLDKLVRDLSELVPASKKPRMDSPTSTKSHTPSPAPTSPGFFERGSTGSRSVQSGSSSSAEDLEVDINLEALNDCTCCICKSFNQENGNKLMECHTCQNLFHQECHIPMVSNEEAADPRLVWNCSDCSKTIKKVAPIKISTSGVSKPSKSSSSGKSASPSKMDGPNSNVIFKRTDQKGSSSSSTSGGKPAGMAALAASYKSTLTTPVVTTKIVAPTIRSGRSGMSSSNSSSSSTNSSGASSSTLMTADKRLQMMKKKAAAQRKVR